jgi:hypothetical protein
MQINWFNIIVDELRSESKFVIRNYLLYLC